MKYLSLSLALVATFLAAPSLAAPYSWQAGLPAAYQAPSDIVSGGAIKGACLQGGLIDLRYGQAAIDTGGLSEVLEIGKQTLMTLDGHPTSSDELLKEIPSGLAATVRYNPRTGQAGWIDAFSHSGTSQRVNLDLSKPRGTAYVENESIAIKLDGAQARRLQITQAHLTIPGMVHGLTFSPDGSGGFKALLKVQSGWNFSKVPIFVKIERQGRAPIIAQGQSISVATSAPEVVGFGPQTASSDLKSIAGWVDVTSEAKVLNPASARITAAPGCRITEFQPRVDRSLFKIEADGPGEYWLDFSISDQVGHKTTKRWNLKVVR